MSPSAAEARLRALMECSPAGVAHVDAAGRVLEANDAWRDLCAALGPGAAVEDWRELILPEDRVLVAGGAVQIGRRRVGKECRL